MPKKLEQKLKKEVAGKNWSQERKDAYVYGTMRKTGWVPSTQKKGGANHSNIYEKMHNSNTTAKK